MADRPTSKTRRNNVNFVVGYSGVPHVDKTGRTSLETLLDL